MNWSKLLKTIVHVAVPFTPLLLLFGIPPIAGTILEGVEHIYADPNRPNDDALALTAAAADALDRRLAVVEKRLGIDPAKDPLKGN